MGRGEKPRLVGGSADQGRARPGVRVRVEAGGTELNYSQSSGTITPQKAASVRCARQTFNLAAMPSSPVLLPSSPISPDARTGPWPNGIKFELGQLEHPSNSGLTAGGVRIHTAIHTAAHSGQVRGPSSDNTILCTIS